MKKEELEKDGWKYPEETKEHIAIDELSLFATHLGMHKGKYLLQFDIKNKRIRIKKDKEIIFLGVCEDIIYFKDICLRNHIY